MPHSSFIRRFLYSILAIASLTWSAAAIAVAPPPAGNYKIDPFHSVAYFEIGHMGGISRFMGRFNEMSGELVIDAPEKSNVKVEIKVDSIDVKFPALEKHLKSPDFFDAAKFPILSFTSTAVTLNADGEGTLVGNLTLHGVPKSVTFKLKYIGAGTGMGHVVRAGYVATATIKRSDFGINYGIPQAATDEVDLNIHIEASKM